MISKFGFTVRQKFSLFPYILGYVGKLFASSAFFFVREKAARKILIMQLLFTFIEALSLIAFLSLAIGSTIYLAGNSFLMSIGQTELIYDALVVIIAEELGPILVAFVVTARSATAIATEIASMVISHQIESYVSIGVDPIGHLAAPRFLGVTFSVFFLNLYFSLCGFIGPGIILRVVNPVLLSEYFSGLLNHLTFMNIYVSISKSILFGMIISTVATYFGFNVERASTEVPVAGIQAVSKSFMYIILADVIFIVLRFAF